MSIALLRNEREAVSDWFAGRGLVPRLPGIGGSGLPGDVRSLHWLLSAGSAQHGPGRKTVYERELDAVTAVQARPLTLSNSGKTARVVVVE